MQFNMSPEKIIVKLYKGANFTLSMIHVVFQKDYI